MWILTYFGIRISTRTTAILGGIASFFGLESVRRPEVKAEACPGGAICGAGEDVRLGQFDSQLSPPAAARAG